MSVAPEPISVVARQPTLVKEEPLLFAAASLIREMDTTDGQPVREVISDDRHYRLEGRRLQTASGVTGPVILVFVEPVESLLPHDQVLKSRFGLTRKEIGVARLIAEDKTNGQIARELSISPHTARHHTERILSKLGVKSRTKVRVALSQ